MKIVTDYDPFVYDENGEIVDTKPLADDPRCLFGWGPPSCNCYFGHACVREFGHPGKCWDGIETDAPKCSRRRRPKDWDSAQRLACNNDAAARD